MSDLNRSIKIFIDGTEATQSVSKVEKSIASLEAKLNSLNTSEANYGTRSKQLQKEISNKYLTLETYKKKIAETERVLKNLSGASYSELIAVQRNVRRELNNLTPETEKYNRTLEQHRRVTEAVTRAQSAMRVEVASQGTTFGKVAGFFNKYLSLIASSIAGITGITMTLRNSVKEYAQVSEAMAGVKKYTGMADDQIKELNEDFKKMDTRTARIRLNELAQDAGRLGIKGRKDILDFVDAANVINVALGEDLGEDAVKNIGKLAQMFGDDKKMGLRGAMLATGSAINEVAQNSSAAEKYLVDFTARVAGTGKQAGIAQTQIIGFASVLDQDMQQVEMSATALQTVIMKIYQEPAKFARLVGKDVKEFSALLKNDANEAILQFFEAINSRGGLSETASLFKEMGLNGTRASGVINALAANTGKIRQEQARANEAYREGTSVLNEYAVQNNTVQAGLDKAKKKFKEVIYEMGERLAPTTSKLILSSGDLIRVLSKIVALFFEYSGVISTVTTVIIAYIAYQKLTVYWTKLVAASTKLAATWKVAYSVATAALSGNLTGAHKIQKLFSQQVSSSAAINKIATLTTYLYASAVNLLKGNFAAAGIGMKSFFSTLISGLNPITLIIGAMTAATVISYKWNKSIRERYDAEKVNEKLSQRVAERVASERKIIEDLTAKIHDNNIKIDERREAVEKLKGIIPGYNAEITDEGTVINENTKELVKFNEELARSIELTEINDELLRRRKEVDRLKKSSAFKDNSLMGSMARGDVLSKIADEEKVIDSLLDRYDKLSTKRTHLGNPDDQTPPPAGGGGGGTPPPDDVRLKNFDTTHQDKLNRIRLNGLEEKKAEFDIKADILAEDREYYAKRIQLLSGFIGSEKDAEKKAGYERERVNSRTKLLETEVSIEQLSVDRINKIREDSLLKEQENFNRQTEDLQAALETQAISKEEFAFFSRGLAINHADLVLSIEKNFQEDLLELDLSSGAVREKAIYDSNKRIAKSEREVNRQRLAQQKALNTLISDFKGEFKIGTIQEDQEAQLAVLEAAYQARKKLAEKEKLDTTELDAAYYRAKENITTQGEERLLQLRAKYGIDVRQQQYDLELKQLKEHLDNKELTEKEYYEALEELDNKYSGIHQYNLGITAKDLKEAAKGDMMAIKKVFDYYSALLQDAVSSLKDAELANIDAKYDAEIAAAQGNSEEIERLENEKAQKKLDVEKKYADINFAIKASQIIVDTSLAIMAALAQLGPIAGPIAAAFMGVTGAAQLAIANSERERVKSMTLSGSSSSSKSGERVVTQRAEGNYDVIGADDGRTYRDVPYIGEPTTGIVRRTSLISENGSELIVNSEDLSRLQKHINYPTVLQAINDARMGRVPQRAEGNYDSIPDLNIRTSQTSPETLKELIQAIVELRKATEAIRMIKAFILYQDIEKAKKNYEEAQKPFTRGDK